MQTRGDILNANRHELIQTAISNFSTPEVVYNTQHTTLTQTCTLHYLGAIRVKARWYTNIQLTNLPTHFHVPIFTRQYVTEFIHAKGGKLSEALRMKLPVRPAGDERRKMRNDTTTIIVTGRGDVNPSFFGRQLAQDNPAVIASLERGEFFILQAADSLTLSSIAILMLPLLLNLIPVSFIADVKRGTMFVYILLSDVLTCLPLLVKGAELISISSLRHRNIVTRVSSTVNGSVSESAAAELFGAECRAKREFWGIGVAFVTIAVGFMVGGIVAEFVARIYWRRVRKRAFMTLLETGIGASGFKMGEYANKRNDVWD